MEGETTRATPIIDLDLDLDLDLDHDHDQDLDDWDKPFTNEELEAIDAAFEAASSQSSSSSSSHVRRRLPPSIDSAQRTTLFAPLPCSTRLHANLKMEYPSMKFGGRIVYCRTFAEVQRATSDIIRLLWRKRIELGRAILGLDIEWKPSFTKGIPQGKAAVLQICGDMEHCYVLHIIHSGIPQNLRSLLEDPTSIKVGVGIDNDGVKMFHDHNVSIKPVEDLSSLANKKLGGASKHWSLSSLVETLTSKQLLKPKKIRLGNWEASFLGKQQREYAATDAFASWYVYEVLHSFPELSTENQKKQQE